MIVLLTTCFILLQLISNIQVQGDFIYCDYYWDFSLGEFCHIFFEVYHTYLWGFSMRQVYYDY